MVHVFSKLLCDDYFFELKTIFHDYSIIKYGTVMDIFHNQSVATTNLKDDLGSKGFAILTLIVCDTKYFIQ